MIHSSPPSPPRAWRAPLQPPLTPLPGLRALLGFVLCFAWPLAVLMLAKQIPAAHGHGLLVISLGTTAVTLTYLALVRLREWRQAMELGLRPLPRELGFGLALGVIACLCIEGGTLVLQAWHGAAAPSGEFSRDAALGAFVQSRQNAIVEEIAFLGLLLRWLLSRLGADRAIAVQALVFGAAHYPGGGVPSVLLATAMGLVFGYAFLWRRSLWTPIGLHMAWDALALFPGQSTVTEDDSMFLFGWLLIVALLMAWWLRSWALEWSDMPTARIAPANQP